METTLAATAKLLQKGSVSSVELTEDALRAIHKNKELNCFISIDEELALSEARNADNLIKIKHAFPLTGIPYALKDLFCTKKMATTCGSKMLEHFQSPYEASIVTQLRNQGAVLIGKTNLDEFAMGSANEFSYFGAVKNPWNTTCVPGGSSGGSAAAVAARLVPYAIGSDTGGSIRQPAAFCGISGIKPTYGLISRFGMVAYASSLDQAGPMARSVEDLALILQALVAFDPHDSTSIKHKAPDYHKELSKPLSSCKIGLPSCFFQPEVDKDIQNAVLEACAVYTELGAQFVDIELRYHDLWVPCYYVIACAEASSNLSRYDGIRFGYRSTKASTLKELITHSRSEGFGEEVQRRILTGTHVLSAGFFDAYYLQALKIRRLIQDELLAALNQVDLLLGPTTPTCAFALKNKISNPTQNYLSDVFTVAANLAGLPALSVPAGFSNGLPIGIQMMAKPFHEHQLLNAAHHFQCNTNWHKASPKGSR